MGIALILAVTAVFKPLIVGGSFRTLCPSDNHKDKNVGFLNEVRVVPSQCHPFY